MKALIAHGEKVGRPMELLNAVIAVNREQPRQVLALLKKHFPALKNIRVAVLGLAFKPGTDDTRESPAIPIIAELIAQGARIKAYDPVVGQEMDKFFGKGELKYCDELDQVITGVEAILLLTRWDEFKRIPELLAKIDPQPLLVDGRRMLDKHKVARYVGIGL